MALIEWREEFSLGIVEIDYEHRELIALINALHTAVAGDGTRNRILEFFGDLYANISLHFALEERMMRDSAYAGYADHKADHNWLLSDIREIMDGFEAGAYDDFETILAAHLDAWFTEHFKTHDARLHQIGA